MCGIVGNYMGAQDVDERVRIDRALSRLRHRGPNDQGVLNLSAGGGALSLAHTRLSIIDLSAGGHQPMVSPDGRWTIVFNGEIYNYRELRQELKSLGFVFNTASDTEVLLSCWARWGMSCLPKLRGMFAFAVFDRQTQVLTCVRDAFGIKPLFYSLGPTEVCFASEVPALLELLADRPKLDQQCAFNYLMWGSYDDSEATFYSGVRQLMPGCWLSVKIHDRGTVQANSARWWWPEIQERTDLSFGQAAEAFRAMFIDSVRLHLRSDVPLGAALSGGLDSSALVCVMRHLEPAVPIHTFSFIAPGTATDEERWVDIVNAHVGAVSHKVQASSADLAADLDDMVHAQGEPFGSTSIYAQYRVFRLARDHGVTVTLDGQGADELLAGYNGFPEGYVRSLLDRAEPVAAIRFLLEWSRWPGRRKLEALRILGSAVAPQPLRSIAIRLRRDLRGPRWIKWKVLDSEGIDPTPDRYEVGLDGDGRRLVEALRATVSGQGLAALLRHGDRNSMRWSVESRVPFLTTEIAEFLFTLPESYLLSPEGETKRLLRTAMCGLVPAAILERRDKIGFRTPEREWLSGQYETAQEWLSGAEGVPFLDSDNCRRFVAGVLGGRLPYSAQVWRLINYCRWIQLRA